jgi:hypothetical protein
MDSMDDLGTSDLLTPIDSPAAWRQRLSETEIAALTRAEQWGDTRPGALRGGALVGRHAITA